MNSQPYAISLKPAADVREKLRKAADAAGRTLTKEMELRLAASVQGEIAPSELFAGWPAKDQMRFRSLANVVALLCARIALVTGKGTPHAYLLGALRTALAELFESVGTPEIAPDDQKFFAMIPRQMLAEIRFAATFEGLTGEKAAFADFASAWGVEKSNGGTNVL